MSCPPRTQESPVITLARRRRMSAYRFDFQLGADSASVARQRYPKRLRFRRKLDELFNTYSNDTTFSRLMGCLSLFSCNFSPSPLIPIYTLLHLALYIRSLFIVFHLLSVIFLISSRIWPLYCHSVGKLLHLLHTNTSQYPCSIQALLPSHFCGGSITCICFLDQSMSW